MAKRRLKYENLISFACVIVGFIMLYSVMLNVFRVIDSHHHLIALQSQRDALLAEKNALSEEVELLNDEDYVVIYAREHYVFTKDGEVVATLPDDKK